jgi:hypothetical protein
VPFAVPAALSCHSIADPPLRCSLRENQIGAAGAAALSYPPKSRATLLRDNQIGAADAAALSEALKSNATLTSLE